MRLVRDVLYDIYSRLAQCSHLNVRSEIERRSATDLSEAPGFLRTTTLRTHRADKRFQHSWQLAGRNVFTQLFCEDARNPIFSGRHCSCLDLPRPWPDDRAVADVAVGPS